MQAAMMPSTTPTPVNASVLRSEPRFCRGGSLSQSIPSRGASSTSWASDATLQQGHGLVERPFEQRVPTLLARRPGAVGALQDGRQGSFVDRWSER